MLKRGFFICLISILGLPLFGQYIPGQNWKQMESSQYQLIFPDFLKIQADEAYLLTLKYEQVLQQGLNPHRFMQYPLVLYPWSMISNGYVTSLVHHSLWYTAPKKHSLGSLSWPELLAIHEGRHVMQMQTLLHSTSMGLYYMGGELLFSLSVISVPSWVYEGDAVFTETVLGNSGRGRQSSFDRNMRILWNEGNIPSYSALFLPSRKNLNTNAYSGGYFFTSWIKKEYGVDVIGDFYRYQAGLPLPVFGTARAFKQISNQSLRHNYHQFSDAMSQWFQMPHDWSIEIEWITPPSDKSWIIYSQLLKNQDHLYALVHSPSMHSRVIRVDEESRKIRDLDVFSRMDLSDNQIIWDQSISGDRYTHSNETEIWTMDLRGHSRNRLLPAGRYFSPSYHPDGKKIAMIELDQLSLPSLLLIDTKANLQERVKIENALAAFWPSWSPDGKSLLLVLQNHSGTYLAEYTIESKQWSALTAPGPRSLDRPFWIGNNPAFLVDDEERMNLIMLKEDKLYRLNAGGYGISSAGADRNGTLYLVSRNSGRGDQIGRINNPEWTVIEPEELTRPSSGYFQQVLFDNQPIFSPVAEATEVKPYRTPLFNPYSWGFVTILGDIPEGSYLPINLASQDPLNSNSWELTYMQNVDGPKSSLRFIGDFNYLYTPVRITLLQDIPGMEEQAIDSIASLGISLPLGLHRGNRHFSTQSYGAMQGLIRQTGSDQQFLLLAETQFNMKHWKTGSSRDIGNRWEQGFSAWLNQPLEPQQDGTWGFSINTAVPGPWNQRLEARYTREYNPLGLISNAADPRGWDIDFDEDFEAIRSTYHIPLLYPELELSKFYFLSRIRLSGFYDRKWNHSGQVYSSTGAELTLDFYPLQLPVELYAGLRYSYRIEDQSPLFEITLMSAELF